MINALRRVQLQFLRIDMMICLAVVSVLVVGCSLREKLPSDTPVSVTSIPSSVPVPSYIAVSDHLKVRIDSAWRMDQRNSVVVDVVGIDEPLILSVELEPSFVEEPILQKPVAINGTPVAGNLQEITGFQVVQRVDRDTDDVIASFPELLFKPDLYTDRRKIDGWQMTVVLTTRIDAYPAVGGKHLGDKYVISANDIAERLTLITSMPRGESPQELEEYEHIIVPDSTYGMFSYFLSENVIDSIILASDLSFDFIPSESQE
jgi:hypothetical protein